MDSLSSERHNDSIYLHVVVRQFLIGSFGKKPKKTSHRESGTFLNFRVISLRTLDLIGWIR